MSPLKVQALWKGNLCKGQVDYIQTCWQLLRRPQAALLSCMHPWRSWFNGQSKFPVMMALATIFQLEGWACGPANFHRDSLQRVCDTSSRGCNDQHRRRGMRGSFFQGAQEKEKALSFAHFIIRCGIRRLLQEPILVHECVDSFPRDIISELLPMYDSTWAIVSPHQHGWPIRRVRQWAVARHKTKTLACATMLNIFTNMLGTSYVIALFPTLLWVDRGRAHVTH